MGSMTKMPEYFARSTLLLGEAALEKLKNSSVAIFGLGGVGSFAAEAAARGGIGSIALIDSDKICETNINRQIIALTDTIGKTKADAMAKRIKKLILW
mgnify:CR=1 FL=1